jgi:hypothetical protein
MERHTNFSSHLNAKHLRDLLVAYSATILFALGFALASAWVVLR